MEREERGETLKREIVINSLRAFFIFGDEVNYGPVRSCHFRSGTNRRHRDTDCRGWPGSLALATAEYLTHRTM
jgi:hypothetical protein